MLGNTGDCDQCAGLRGTDAVAYSDGTDEKLTPILHLARSIPPRDLSLLKSRKHQQESQQNGYEGPRTASTPVDVEKDKLWSCAQEKLSS